MNRLIFVVFITLLYGDIKKDFFSKNYSKVCSVKNIYKYKNNDKILSIIGKACLNIDSIYLLPKISKFLIHTKEGRLNSLYFLTIVLQKRLIYNYIFDKSNRSEIGFIAEEVNKSLPQLVYKNKDTDETIGMDYSKMTAVLVKAMQEQQEYIEGLEKRINELETK